MIKNIMKFLLLDFHVKSLEKYLQEFLNERCREALILLIREAGGEKKSNKGGGVLHRNVTLA